MYWILLISLCVVVTDIWCKFNAITPLKKLLLREFTGKNDMFNAYFYLL